MTKKVFLWTAPRCISTAFERCIMEIEHSKIFHEPFSKPYHFGPERKSQRYLSQPVDPTVSYEAMKSILTKEYDGLDLIFSKDMAYAIEDCYDILADKDFNNWQHTFLMRNPRKTVPSLYKASVNKTLTGWECFDPHEAGFEQLQDLFDFVKENFDKQPVVVDADDLMTDPESTMKAYCGAIGIEFKKDILAWEPGEVEGWDTWNGWHENALKSCGFSRQDPAKLMRFEDLSMYPKIVEDSVNQCLPYYTNLSKFKLNPNIMTN
ncbi:uncharacterized protein [Clytia hemisphaerica]|uniref:uncharacterized protein n=1 Tax=Clytia hemisphaerica TaxID=252671 RepID=UPI0034D6F641|eukprot:TCONS_00059828-protein